MSKERNWHPNFIKYMDYIVGHKNYEGLCIEKSDNSYGWIATAKGNVGKKRIEWAIQKAKELNIEIKPGVYREVMFAVHPTKKKVCQICGRELSLDYIYLNNSFIKFLKNNYNIELNELNSIYDVVTILKNIGKTEEQVIEILKNRFNLSEKVSNLDLTIKECIQLCTKGKSKDLGPGCMSNFPDRFDGFHTYNRCCRSREDTGRSKENLYSYGKDRRAYEYWSDGNIHAANKFMHSSFFENTSADHVGPISLGFIHDSRTLRKMPVGENSSKRDRLLYEDVVELQEIEQLNDICVISWYSSMIWEFIKNNLEYSVDLEKYRIMLKQNMSLYMEILWTIKNNCKEKGEKFLIENLLLPKYECFKYDYEFNELGQIIKQIPRNITESTKKEFDRYVRIALASVDEYHEKENRKMTITLKEKNKLEVMHLCDMILKNENAEKIISELKNIVKKIQEEILSN